MTRKPALLLTQAAYARSRKARGLSGGSRQAVKKAVDEGRISAFGPDKMVDPALADRQWDENTRARAANDAPTVPAGAGDLLGELTGPPAPPAGDEAGADPATTSLQADVGYQAARSRQATADARTAEIRLAELEGSLVRIEQVKAELAAMLAPVREAVLQIPARMAPLLAPLSDPGRIQTLLEVEIHQILAPLSKASVVHAPAGDGAAP